MVDFQLDKLCFPDCKIADPSQEQGRTCAERKPKQEEDQKSSLQAQDPIHDLLQAQDPIHDLPSVDDYDYVYQTTILGQLNENLVSNSNVVSPYLEESSEKLALLEESILKMPTFKPVCATSQRKKWAKSYKKCQNLSQRKKRAKGYKKFQNLSSFKAAFNLEAIAEEGDTESSGAVADNDGLVFINKF